MLHNCAHSPHHLEAKKSNKLASLKRGFKFSQVQSRSKQEPFLMNVYPSEEATKTQIHPAVLFLTSGVFKWSDWLVFMVLGLKAGRYWMLLTVVSGWHIVRAFSQSIPFTNAANLTMRVFWCKLQVKGGNVSIGWCACSAAWNLCWHYRWAFQTENKNGCIIWPCSFWRVHFYVFCLLSINKHFILSEGAAELLWACSCYVWELSLHNWSRC